MRQEVKSNGKPLHENLMAVAQRLRSRGLYAKADSVFSSAKQAYLQFAKGMA